MLLKNLKYQHILMSSGLHNVDEGYYNNKFLMDTFTIAGNIFSN